MKRIAVLLGIHGSGKSALGASLPADKFAFYPEIGTALRIRTTKAVTEFQELFDERVMEEELERDEQIWIEERRPVVETWHLGNIAFAQARGSHPIVARYRAAFARQLCRFDVDVIKLQLSDQDFAIRVTEKNISATDALRFYRSVERHQDSIVMEYLGAGQPSLVLQPPWDPRDAAAILSQQLD